MFRFGGECVAGDEKRCFPVGFEQAGDGVCRYGLHGKDGDEGRIIEHDRVVLQGCLFPVCSQGVREKGTHGVVLFQGEMQHELFFLLLLALTEGASAVSA